jgi:PAS domain S-box-containing protein
MENRKIKILLIEDSVDDAELIKRKLEQSANVRFSITAVKRLDDGLKQIAKTKPDVILSDLGLPDSHGLDTVTKILLQVPRIPLVVLSGFDDEDIAIKAVQSGAQDYLVKGQMDNSQLERSLYYAIERAHLQDELEQNAQKISSIQANLLKILENNVDAIVVVSEDGHIQFTNPAVESLFGRKQKELLNKPFDFPLDGGKTSEIEIKRRGNEITTAEISVVKISWEGKPANLVSMHDITKRKAMENALRVSEEKFSKAFLNSPEAIVISNIEDSTILEANDTFLRLTGYTREEVVGKKNSELGTWAVPEERTAVIKKLQEKGTVSNRECHFRMKSGEIRIWLFSAEIINIDNKPCMLSVTTDITERKKTEEALKQSEEKYRELINTSTDGIVSIDSQMRFIVWNHGAERIFGYTEKEMLGQSVLKIVPEMIRKGMTEGFNYFVKTGSREISDKILDVVGVRKDGTEVPIEISISTRKVGDTFIATAIIRDITLRKEAEEKLRKLDQMKSEFLSNVSHELRTPLQSISGFTKLIMSGQVPDPATQQEFFQIVDRETMHLGNLINSLLDMSRLEAGRFQIYKKLIPIRDTIIDAMKMFRSLAREKNITLSENIPPQIPEIEVDYERMRQVIINLLSNAIKFSDPGSSVKVNVEKRKDELLFQVIDHGTGIREEAMKHLFERFYRVEGETVRGGTGLGLYISKQIIDAHGGRIWAESKYGEGSTFSFTLPLNSKGGNENGKENSGNRRRSGNIKTGRLFSNA